MIKDHKNAVTLAAGLKALGWTPTIGQVSRDNEVRGHTIGVLVKIGDERLTWKAHDRNPVIDFFSIANVAAGHTKSLCQQPVGFAWAMAGVDTVQLEPNRNEKIDAFVGRLRALTPPQYAFDFGPPPPRPAAQSSAAVRP